MQKIYFILIIFLFSSCASLKCTQFGVFEYCSPTPKNSSNNLTSALKRNKTKEELSKDKNLFIESKKLQKQWLNTISNTVSYLYKNNMPLYGEGLIPSGQGLNGKYPFSIKLIQKNNNVKIELDKEVEEAIYLKSLLVIRILGKNKIQKNPELLYKAVPELKFLLDLENAKIFIANSFQIIIESRYLAKKLSEYYVKNKHKVYITSKNISPHVDIKGNLYLNNKIIQNLTFLKLIMIHEAFHLLPVGINNNIMKESIFKNFISKQFAKNTVKSVLNTKKHMIHII